MAAVIREAGDRIDAGHLGEVVHVSSGSLYYRFPDRPAVLAALRNRAIVSYHRGAYSLFDDDPLEAAVVLATHAVRWCRTDPLCAHVLLAGPPASTLTLWPEAARESEATESSRWGELIRELVRGLRAATLACTTEVLLVVVDLPWVAVRRYLSAGRAVSDELPEVVTKVVHATLR